MPISASDDLTGQYLNERQSTELTPYDELMRSQTSVPFPPDEMKDSFILIPEKPKRGFFRDIGRGTIEAPSQVVGGFHDAIKEMSVVVDGLFKSINVPTALQIINEQGEFDPELMPSEEFYAKGGKTPMSAFETHKAESISGGLVRGISQFLTGFATGGKLLKGVKPVTKVGKVAKTMIQGAFADAAAFDAHEQRMSDLIEKFPVLSNPVTRYLQADPTDTEAEGRFKNAIEGMGLGGLTDTFFYAIRGIRGARQLKLQKEMATQEKEVIDHLADVPETAAPETLKTVETEDIVKIYDTDAPVFEIGSKKAGDERALNINTDRLNTTDDVKGLIEDVGKKFAPDINEARRQVITFEEQSKLADELGMTVDDLLNRRRGEAFNAEQAIAARRILVSSGENLIKLAKTAQTGADLDVLKFRQAMAKHKAIQSQVSGMTAEAGRALGSFNIVAKGAKEQERMIQEVLNTGGGIKDSKKLAQMVSELEEGKQLNTFVDQAAKATTKEMLYEAWINGLLSNPATHTVNVLSNSITSFWAVGERKVASMIGAGLDNPNIPSGEASAQLFGLIQGAKDGFRLAWQSLKTGEPSDILTKVEHQDYRAITGENLSLSGPLGRFADFIGGTVRMPGRFLTASDEFFKSVGYRAELQAQAFRQGVNEGLQGKELAKRVSEIIDNPPENLHLSAVDASRYSTFTKELGASGQALQDFVGKTPGAKLIVPFIRTPVNIMKFTGERTPIAPLSKAVREEIKAGGARRDMALAKIATGSMIMAVAADMTLTGQITGGGPKNPQMRQLLMATGWQPYSIKIDDKYYSYSRLDPIGATIGTAADISEIMGQIDDQEALDLATASVVAVGQNVTSKTYLKGVAEFFDVMSSVSADPEDRNKRAKRWIERFAGSVIPSGVAGLERQMSPELSATNGILEKLKSRIPGYADDLPPRRNIFGEPIVLEGGIGPDIMSPIYVSTDKKDPIADEIVEQQTLLRMPRNVIDGVELTTQEYDEYIRLYSGENNRFVKQPLKRALSELFRNPLYKKSSDGQDGGKSILIRAQFEAYREAAKQAFLENNREFMLKVKDLKREEIMKLKGR